MAGQAIWAPLHRALGRFSNPGAAGFPLNAAPSFDFLASGLQDHRMAYNSRGSSSKQPGIVGWYGAANPTVCNLQPAAAAVNNIAAAANPASGVAMTLVSSSGSGVVVATAAAPAFFMPTGLQLTSGVFIDALPTVIVFGANGNFQTGAYNRSTCVGRCVSVTGVASGSGGAVKISGYDTYGYPMSQTVTLAAGANTVNTTKAFKCVTSVVPAFTDTHTISVGVADIFGLGIFANLYEDCTIYWNGSLVTASTGFTAGDTTSPATQTTGDVRGTYAVQSASDGTKRLLIAVRPVVSLLATNPTTGLFGQPQT